MSSLPGQHPRNQQPHQAVFVATQRVDGPQNSEGCLCRARQLHARCWVVDGQLGDELSRRNEPRAICACKHWWLSLAVPWVYTATGHATPTGAPAGEVGSMVRANRPFVGNKLRLHREVLSKSDLTSSCQEPASQATGTRQHGSPMRRIDRTSEPPARFSSH